MAQAFQTMAHSYLSNTRQIQENQSHTSLHAIPSTLVTGVSHQRSTIGTFTCKVGGHKNRFFSPSEKGGLAQEGNEWNSLERGSAHSAHQCPRVDIVFFFTLLHFQTVLRGKHVLVHTDNKMTVFYINHQEGTRSNALQVAHNLLVLAHVNLPSIRTVYLQVQLNQIMDALWWGVAGRLDSTSKSGANDIEDVLDHGGRCVIGQSDVSLPSLVFPDR